MAVSHHGRRCKISSQPAAEDPEHVAIPLAWGDPQGLPVLAANQLAVQFDSFDGRPDLVILTFGHVAAPILVGSDDQRKRAVEQIKKVASTVLRDARRRLDGGSGDRLAELREAAAQRRRDLVDYDDPEDEAAERADVVEMFGKVQAGTAAWTVGD